MNCFRLLYAVTVFVAASPSLAWAQAWPAKPVTFILAATPGNTNEIETRLYAKKLGENIPGGQFIVDFKPGAGGTIAASHVARGSPDGHLLLVISRNYTILPAAFQDLPYDPVKDLAAVTMLSTRPTVLMSHPSVPAKTAREYFAYAKANPGKLNFGTTGVGSSPHLNGAWMHSMAGVKVNFIHYKGTGAMMPDLLAGRIHSTSVSFLSSMPHIKAGKTIALGITTADRSPLWADLPTLDEQGVKGYDYGSWIGVFATGGTPSGTLARVHAELAKAGKAPEIRQKLEPDFVQIIVSSPEIFQRHVIEDIARWRELGKEVEIKVE